jgi:hypothetical protein
MPPDDADRSTSTGLKLTRRHVHAFRQLARLRSLRGAKTVTAHGILRALALDYLKRHKHEVDEALALEQEGGRS